MIQSAKIAVIGDKDSILAFKAVGVEVFSASNVFEASHILKKLTDENYGVIFITEDIAALVVDILDKLKDRPTPAVIPIPSSQGETGLGMAGIKKDVEKAIGVDILFNK